jgi:hypothetical protein
VSLVDFYPTILNVVGVAVDQPLNGMSLLAPAPIDLRPIFFE